MRLPEKQGKLRQGLLQIFTEYTVVNKFKKIELICNEIN